MLLGVPLPFPSRILRLEGTSISHLGKLRLAAPTQSWGDWPPRVAGWLGGAWPEDTSMGSTVGLQSCTLHAEYPTSSYRGQSHHVYSLTPQSPLKAAQPPSSICNSQPLKCLPLPESPAPTPRQPSLTALLHLPPASPWENVPPGALGTCAAVLDPGWPGSCIGVALGQHMSPSPGPGLPACPLCAVGLVTCPLCACSP